MKYKAGDKIKIKNIDWYNANKNYEGELICEDFSVFDESMSEFCGKVVTIAHVNEKGKYYDIEEDGLVNYWTDEMIECLVYESQEKMVSLDEVCDMLYEMLSTHNINDYDYVIAYAYDDVVDFVEDFRKTFEK